MSMIDDYSMCFEIDSPAMISYAPFVKDGNAYLYELEFLVDENGQYHRTSSMRKCVLTLYEVDLFTDSEASICRRVSLNNAKVDVTVRSGETRIRLLPRFEYDGYELTQYTDKNFAISILALQTALGNKFVDATQGALIKNKSKDNRITFQVPEVRIKEYFMVDMDGEEVHSKFTKFLYDSAHDGNNIFILTQTTKYVSVQMNTVFENTDVGKTKQFNDRYAKFKDFLLMWTVAIRKELQAERQ